ncbi:MAG TPA: dihydroneopterin aldolase [Rhizobium sp.]|nr:dihydroneopterin aldolase [Rhizobium sp.]
MKPLVVKLGGSTAGSKEMQQWIDLLADASLPLVLVPGGGPFADHIRTMQMPLGYSDEAAHDMAILAMDQFGLVVAERSERLRPSVTIHDMEQAWNAGLVPVWLPSTMTRGAPDILRSWRVTSDSLAAWLAGRLGAERLLLIKQVAIDPDEMVLDVLVAQHLVDDYLPRILSDETKLYLAGPESLGAARHVLAALDVPGRLVVREALEEVLGS